MQKLWSGKGKRSQPLPIEDTEAAPDDSNSVSQEADQQNTDAANSPRNRLELLRNILENSQKFFKDKVASRFSASGAIFTVGIGGVIFVTILATHYLTAPDSTPDSKVACKSKISGNWQTPLGKLTLEDKGNDQVLGKYAYTNFERGKVVGEFIGKLRNNVVTFDWQETPYQQSQQQGKGILVFDENCKSFYGSYGTGNSTNNFGNWQGSNFPK